MNVTSLASWDSSISATRASAILHPLSMASSSDGESNLPALENTSNPLSGESIVSGVTDTTMDSDTGADMAPTAFPTSESSLNTASVPNASATHFT